MYSAYYLFISNNSIFYALSKRYFCITEVSHSNGLEMFIAHKSSHKFWMLCSNYGQEISFFPSSILKFYVRIREPFISMIRGSFRLDDMAVCSESRFLSHVEWGYQTDE